VRFCGEEFECLDDLPVGADVDVVIRPEDIEMTAVENGSITGYVQSVIFKGMHYEITVKSGKNEIVIKSTKSANINDFLGLKIEPEGIHVIHAETNINIFDGVITAIDKVAFADGEFECDVTQLYPGYKMYDNMLVDTEGNELNIVGTQVTVKVPIASVSMSDDIEVGSTDGHIVSLIYKGDHYHYIIRTKSEEDIHLHDPYLWNEEDHVSIVIPKDAIELSLRVSEE